MSQAPEQRVLPLLYVVNDVMQQSRKRGPQFLHAFGKVGTAPSPLQWSVVPLC